MKKSFTNLWNLRIHNANKHYEAWESRFKCDDLEEYYEGFQVTSGNPQYKPYSLNIIYAAIKSKLATILFQNPEYLITPRAGKMDWNQDSAVKSALLKQDVLNTIVSNPNLDFPDAVQMCALDAYFRFAVMEVGYSATWDNPNKQSIEMASHTDGDLVGSEKDKVVEDVEVPVEEQIYFKYIPARRFRVSTSDGFRLKNCAWAGYYEFIYRNVLENTKGIKFPSDLRTNTYSVDYISSGDYEKDDLDEATVSSLRSGEVLKVWRIWDNITKKKLLILDCNYEVIWEDTFERLPFATHRFDLRLKGWYPIPPVWQWLSAQNEVNESREQQRKYRRRATRKFQARKQAVDEDELQKFTNEIDGEIIIVKGDNAITPILNPPVDLSIQDGLVQAKDDFDIVAGIPTSRGRASDRQTATAVNKLAQEEQIRQTVEQLDFNKFMISAARECLLQAGERLSEGIWVKYTLDPGSLMEEMQSNDPIYKYVTSNMISDGYDFDIVINVINATPAQMQEEEAKYVKFITLMMQYPMIPLSPKLIRETAYRCGYRNEAIIAEFQKAAILMLQEKAAQQKQSLLGAAMSGGQNGQGPQPSGGGANSINEIKAQMQNQIGGNA